MESSRSPVVEGVLSDDRLRTRSSRSGAIQFQHPGQPDASVSQQRHCNPSPHSSFSVSVASRRREETSSRSWSFPCITSWS
jgi:hypothetical protein